jgi:superfamily II DNA or RNA helicase
MSSKTKDQYINLQVNGRIFPSWVLHNFKSSKLPEIFRKENEDPCNVETKLELREYQKFVGKFLGPGSPYNEILLYHGLGSGKTATSINLMNILYNYNHEVNFVILIKASLRDDPWMKDLKVWLGRDPSEENVDNISKLARYSTLHFVHYDSPYADRDFLNVMKGIDTSKPVLYIIDEAHNFIRNVYSNINSKIGKRAQVIYEYIIRDKKENKNTKIVLISGTPGINTPFELALMFNMLRPGIFPSSELEFNRTFITESSYPILNPLKRNMFERRILGLVSYYIGATPDLYARQELKYVNLPMSDHQYQVYRVFEKMESEIQKRARRYGKQSQLYRTYTRQACNFVFPNVSIHVNGELRPRPGKFRLSDKMIDSLEKGKNVDVKDETEREVLNKYFKALENFITETEKYFQKIHKEDVKNGRTIFDDLDDFKAGFETVFGKKFLKYYESDSPKSELLIQLYDSSPKMTAIAFMTYVSPGKVMVYTNYVVMEGIDMMKVYYRMIGFNDFTIAKDNMGYCEYHGRIDPKDRIKIKNMFNDKNNIRGSKCKVIILSPSATEGIQLLNIRQEHIMEPYWNEVRIQQVIGRGIRQCSHKELPPSERVVSVYRYKVIKPAVLDPDDTVRMTTDEYIEDIAKARANLIESFLSAMKEAAVDCELFKSHNMMSQSYNCFKFPESTITSQHIGPAFKEDIKDDVKYDSGLHAKNSRIERIKVIKINAVYKLNPDNESQPKYSTPDRFWYYPKSGMVYDYETHYPVGQVQFINGLPNKLDKDTYIMSTIIVIPTIVSRETANL